MKEVVFHYVKKCILVVANKLPSFMAKITLFAQVIQKLPKDLIKSLVRKHGIFPLSLRSVSNLTNMEIIKRYDTYIITLFNPAYIYTRM